MSDTRYFPLPGETIQEACKTLQNIRRATGRRAAMVFNDVLIVADAAVAYTEKDLVEQFVARITYKTLPWRVGAKNALNVYEGDRSVCQCHSPDDAYRIVRAMNERNLQCAGTPVQRKTDEQSTAVRPETAQLSGEKST